MTDFSREIVDSSDMNVSVVPSHYPPPAPPDFFSCDKFYHDHGDPGATLHDCQVAFSILDSGLPPGDTVVQWQNLHLQPVHQWALPYTWTYGESSEPYTLDVPRV